MLTGVLVLMSFFALVLFGAWLKETIRQMGADEERLRRVEADLQVAKKQAEIMAQNKSVEDVANDLDRGTF